VSGLAPNLSEQRTASRIVLAAGAAVLLVATLLAFSGKLDALSVLGIPTMDPPFADLRTITGAGDALRLGLDPRVQNPGDPWGRPFNYPGVWLLPARLGVGPSATSAVAAVMWAAFAAYVLVLARCVTRRLESVVLAFALLSPVTWFALERANNDLLVVALVAAGAVLFARRRGLCAVCIGAAATLKLYPIFAATTLVGSGRKGARATLAALFVAFGIYVSVERDELGAIRAATQYWPPISYGIGIAPRWIADNLAAPRSATVAVAYAFAALAAYAGLAALRRAQLVDSLDSTKLSAFHAGASVYVGTYLLGLHFDYRLVFLLLTLPQLVEWSLHGDRRIRWGAAATTCGALLMLWRLAWRALLASTDVGRGLGDALDEVVCAAVWAALASALLATLNRARGAASA